MQTFLAYLDLPHGSNRFQEALTPQERAQVGQFVTHILANPSQQAAAVGPTD